MHGMENTADVGAIVMTLAGRLACCDKVDALAGPEQLSVSVLAHLAPVFA